ncbi:MAG: hypothetical protein ACI8PZ_001336 [Myxococcota bacterium]|jgi:hypothetical protein
MRTHGLALATTLALALACAGMPTVELPTPGDAPADDATADEPTRKPSGGGGGSSGGVSASPKAGCQAVAQVLKGEFSSKPSMSRGESGLCTVDSRGNARDPDALEGAIVGALTGWSAERRLDAEDKAFSQFARGKGSVLCVTTLSWKVDGSGRPKGGHEASVSCGPESIWP